MLIFCKDFVHCTVRWSNTSKIQENILVIGNYVHHVAALLLCGTRSMWIGRCRCVPRTRWVRHDQSFHCNSMCVHFTGLTHITIARIPASDCQINFHSKRFLGTIQVYMQWFEIEKKMKEKLLHSHWNHNNFYRCHRGNNFFLSFFHPSVQTIP